MSASSPRRITGWIAVAISTIVTGFWAFWGIVENFYEGWYWHSLRQNVELMLGQYLLVMFVMLSLTLLAIWLPHVGALAHVVAGFFALHFFRGSSLKVLLPLITGPLVVLGLLYWYGRAEPRRLATKLLIGLTAATLVVCGAYPAWIVARRVDDGDRGARIVRAGAVTLEWAPAGPGWPDSGVTWNEAVRRCRYLNEDGETLADSPQDIWRLPTIEEAVASQSLHLSPAGGVWNPVARTATYQHTPDKEPPLWNPYSQIIYSWTSTSVDDRTAYYISYNGHVIPAQKRFGWGYLGFRAVREVARAAAPIP